MNKNCKKLVNKYAMPYKDKFLKSIILAVLGVFIGMLPYLAVANIIMRLVQNNITMGELVFWCGAAAASYILKVVFATWSTAISHTATFTALKDIRKQVIGKLSRMPMGDLLDIPSGQLKNIIVDRVESLETPLAHLLPEMTANILVPVIIILYMFTLDWRMALLSLVTIPVSMVFMSGALKTYPVQYEGSVKINNEMTSSIVEYVNGIEVIKTFSQSDVSYKKYSDAVNKNAAYFYNWMKSCQWYMASYRAICPAVLLTILPVGFLFYLNHTLSSLDFITIIIVSFGIAGPIMEATNYVDSLASIGTIADQICEILDAPELIRPIEDAHISDVTINMEKVKFSYHKNAEKEVLKNIDLTINPGTITALVGPSGSGKSTIGKLIAGFWDVTDGRITIGGTDIRNIPQRQLSGKIAYVAQDNYLFHDTILENIRIGNKNATDEEVKQAAEKAGCDKFIRGLEKGYDTNVGEAGSHLSGGERQRIAIARAILKDAPIIILDEATAYIDPENEAVIQAAVAKLVKGKTLIVIAHRLSTIMDSDQIIVIENGVIENVGTHKQLLERSMLYHEMWKTHEDIKKGEQI